jgi:predicted phosphoribosyltransferase/alpha-beta hydrolase superfamily lysophospholipase
MVFDDRTEAGRQLAKALDRFADEDVVVLALPRGGVPVGYVVARALDAPLDVILVRKLGVPFQPELAMGAIGEDGVRVLNEEVMALAQVTEPEMAAAEAAQRAEIERRAARFRQGHARVDVTGRTVLIVDDGVATGSTAKAGCRVARAHGAARVVLAVPVAPTEVHRRFAADADEVVVLDTPEPFFAVGQFYRNFTQVTDDEVVELLARARAERRAEAEADDPPRRDDDVEIPVASAVLEGHLHVPEDPIGVVVFAHGSGSSRHSPRNRYVAELLHGSGIATLLFDLLTHAEELDRSNVFDVELLAARLGQVTRWLRTQPIVDRLPLGYFGASTGAAAALWAAADPDADVAAVVSRGGRPDLAEARLASVTAPTLLVVGGRDDVVLELNQFAAARLGGEREVVVVPGATHLFEEPGTLEQAARAAAAWFARHFGADTARPT